jgi:Skp family chaperone for outer membrane proteins
MRTFRLIAVSVVFAAIFAVSALAQTAAGKIGLINTQAFDDTKAGITKYVAAMNSLDNEFKPLSTELQTLGTKINALKKELDDLQAKINDPNNKVPINRDSAVAKAEEYEKLLREYEFKEKDAKARYERRSQVVMGPIRQDIGNAIQEYTKKNGYVLVIDVSKDTTGLILGLDEAADITKQFITFYNARPATTAVVPK